MIEFNPLKHEVYANLDLMRTQQVLINLLTNALKFSNAFDTIRIETKIENIAKDSNEVLLSFSVIDQGIGIAEDELSELFKPFFRSKNKQSLESNKSGNGLGLHICNNIVKQLNGKIEVKSQLTKGTTFVVTLKTVKHSEGTTN